MTAKEILIRVALLSGLESALAELGVDLGRPVLTVVGGAGGLKESHLAAISGLLADVVLALDRWGAAVVYGGTDSGVMGLLGAAREAAGATFPLIAVAADGTVHAPDDGSGARGTAGASRGSVDRAELDSGRSHTVLVPGSQWGDEAPWLAAVATVVAQGSPSATLVLNGGDITYQDMLRSLAADRPVIVVAGTGRAADAVAAVTGSPQQDPDGRAGQIAASPLTRVVALADHASVLAALRCSLTATPV